jgi:nucleoside-diphosphate-sugar epimerase
MLALEHGRVGEVYNLGGGVPISVNEVLALLEQYAGRQAERRYLPPRPGDQRHTLADISKIRDELGFRPRMAPPEGLRAQLEWQYTLLREG